MIINKVFVESSKEPNKNLLWIKDQILYYYSNNGWKALNNNTKVKWEDLLNVPFILNKEDFNLIKKEITSLKKEIEDLKLQVAILKQENLKINK